MNAEIIHKAFETLAVKTCTWSAVPPTVQEIEDVKNQLTGISRELSVEQVSRGAEV